MPNKVLNTYWGYPKFREGQREAIDGFLKGQDGLVILPTGGGKSICFQVAAMLSEGLCVVVSPLISLMDDQVMDLKKRNIKAMSIHGNYSETELVDALDNCLYGKFKLLYLSPERLQHPLVEERLSNMNISLLAIDEAHCISEWGHDFRPSYRKLVNSKKAFGNPPVMALTATATAQVAKDIIENLELQFPYRIQTSYDRKNIVYEVKTSENFLTYLHTKLKYSKGRSIVYTRTRKSSEHIAHSLNDRGLKADFFHGGIEDKKERLINWSSGGKNIMVATTAFGMGIDQPDVRHVIHVSLPHTIENYYQESGRAGRDGKLAYASLLITPSSMEDSKRLMKETTINAKDIEQVYLKLCNYFQIAYGELPKEEFDFPFSDFCKQYHLSFQKTYEILKILDREGVVRLSTYFKAFTSIQVASDQKQIFNYIAKQKKCGVILQLILRLFDGITERPTNINLSYIERKSGLSEIAITKLLKQLETDQMISIKHWQTDSCLLFLIPREDKHSLHNLKKNIQRINKHKVKQLKSVFRYITSKSGCKRAFLLSYFGEKNISNRCNRCSYCTASHDNSDEIDHQILKLISDSAITIERLIHLAKRDQKTIIASLMRLLNEEQIGIDNNQQYYKR